MEYQVVLSLFLLASQFPPPAVGDYLLNLELRVQSSINASQLVFCLRPAGSTRDEDSSNCPYGREETGDDGTGDLGTVDINLIDFPTNVSLSDAHYEIGVIILHQVPQHKYYSNLHHGNI